MKYVKKALLLILCITICSCSSKEFNVINQLEDLNGTKMGCMSGSIFDMTIEEKIDDAEVVYFNSRSELIMGLQQNKIDGYLADKPVALVCCAENDNIRYLDNQLDEVQYGICFSDDASNLREQFNDFLERKTNDGTIKILQDKWICEECVQREIEYRDLSGKNGTIKACTTPDAAPFSFMKNNQYEGYEVELLTIFASEYGYNLDISTTSFDALLSAISSNKYDVAFNGIYITEERKKSVDFSNPTYKSYVVPVVRNLNTDSEHFFDSIINKLYRTFIEEDRYMIIFDGIKITIIITICSLLIGTLVGFIIFLLSRKLGNWFIKLIDTISYIVSGLPVVILLMILFYVVFSKSILSGPAISIVGFSILICCSVYEMLKTGVGAIDIGQYEGAIALGYTDTKAFIKFVLPQALKIIMPRYNGEIISLIKSSSIVGYITVIDLTKASDIIRSRTYDAFFPLIVTGIIYFALSILMTWIAEKLQKQFLPNEKTQEEILKKYNNNIDK